MSARAAVLARALLCVLAIAPAGSRDARAAGVPLQAAAALVHALGGGGRAEATLRWVSAPGPGAPARTVHARLALEPPDRVRLDIDGSGERITLRSDGGEWLQPSTRQLLRLQPRQAAGAMRWWRALLGADPTAHERALGQGRLLVVLPAAQGVPADSAEVTLDAKGLPARLVAGTGGDAVVYRLAGWRFLRARGVAAFRLQAPAGWESVEMP